MSSGSKGYGRRRDGRMLHSLSPFVRLSPYIRPDADSAAVYYDDSFDVTGIRERVEALRGQGYADISVTHFIIAAYIRTISMLPALNRFVVGRHIFAADDIRILTSVPRSSGENATEATVKLSFMPTDTVFDVYRKLADVTEEVRTSEKGTELEQLADTLSRLPRFILRLVLFVLRVMDFWGILSGSFLELSPFHGSMLLSDMSRLHIRPGYHSLYKLGTLPLRVALAPVRAEGERSMLDIRLSLDGRINDPAGHARCLQAMHYLMKYPEILEQQPTKVVEDVY